MDLMQQRYVSLEEKGNRMMLIRFPEDGADTPGGDRDKDWALQYKVRWLEEKMDLMQQRYVSLEEKVNRMMLIRFPEDDVDTPHVDATGVEKQHQEMPSASTHVKEQHQETQSAETPAGFCLTPQELHRKQSA